MNMTVQQLTDALSLTIFSLEEPDRPVTGGYCGDLLSWVMGRAPADGAWLTIMSNVNVAAVAALAVMVHWMGTLNKGSRNIIAAGSRVHQERTNRSERAESTAPSTWERGWSWERTR